MTTLSEFLATGRDLMDRATDLAIERSIIYQHILRKGEEEFGAWKSASIAARLVDHSAGAFFRRLPSFERLLLYSPVTAPEGSARDVVDPRDIVVQLLDVLEDCNDVKIASKVLRGREADSGEEIVACLHDAAEKAAEIERGEYANDILQYKKDVTAFLEEYNTWKNQFEEYINACMYPIRTPA